MSCLLKLELRYSGANPYRDFNMATPIKFVCCVSRGRGCLVGFNHLRLDFTRNTTLWLYSTSVSQSFFFLYPHCKLQLIMSPQALVFFPGNSKNLQLTVICCLGQCYYEVPRRDTMTRNMIHTE